VDCSIDVYRHLRVTRIDTLLGDAAVALLKAGAETDKRDSDGFLALDLAPDREVGPVTWIG
jgi:hypothetical protein